MKWSQKCYIQRKKPDKKEKYCIIPLTAELNYMLQLRGSARHLHLVDGYGEVQLTLIYEYAKTTDNPVPRLRH